MTLVLTVLIFLGCIAMLAIGVMFSRKPIKGGGCCKASDVTGVGDCRGPNAELTSKQRKR
ncbi:hypothetical protein [Vibrio hepatarius]|uniref:hypothetical protein n=1 Tax=Vibrio hepatarius TaxID=171383 RepID=UPI001C0A53DB|nr:hypothetical protein [Vibrio hepatarius]MBU2896271.1 hypothetical protein [Vibrio hepatarius]